MSEPARRWLVTIIDNGTAGGGAHVVLRSDSGEERRVALTMAAGGNSTRGSRGTTQNGDV